jgi:hypothetical protein
VAVSHAPSSHASQLKLVGAAPKTAEPCSQLMISMVECAGLAIATPDIREQRVVHVYVVNISNELRRLGS